MEVLVKVKQPITKGNESGYAIFKESEILPEHEVIGLISDHSSEQKISLAIHHALVSKAFYETLNNDEKKEFQKQISEKIKVDDADKLTQDALKPSKGSKGKATDEMPPQSPSEVAQGGLEQVSSIDTVSGWGQQT